MRIIFAIILGLAVGSPALADTVTSPAYVNDGDTWSMANGDKRITIRPSGIDAPELGQVCDRDGRPWYAGWDAGKWLAEFLHQKVVRCDLTGDRAGRRWVANCTVNGQDLQDVIVRAGWAFDYPKYSGGRFAEAERDARENRRGIWQGTCQFPADWRRENFD